MATTFKWLAPEAIQTALSTELNSLASGSYSNASGSIPNETDLYQFVNLELVLASLTPVAGQTISIYMITTVDGTNYADGGGSTAPSKGHLIAVFDLSTSTGAKRDTRENILIPPLGFKLILSNDSITSGVALGASGNTLKYRRHNGQSV